MAWLGELWRRLRTLVYRDRLDRELAEEMRLHLDLRAAENETGGLPQAGATTAARRRFGNVGRLQEESRDVWGWRWLEMLAQDLRYAARTLAANPGFTATAVLSLALGIGANTAIFNVLNAVLLRTLPVENPHALVQIQQGANGGELTNPLYEQIRDRQQAFSGVLAYCPEGFDAAEGGERRPVSGMLVSGNFFQVLGVPAVQGRVFTPDDDRRGSPGTTAVISYRFWKRNFPDGADVIGKTIRLDRHQFEIVGVTPPWFTGLDADRSFDVAVPLAAAPALRSDPRVLDSRGFWWLLLMGRLLPGETIAEAEQKLNAIAPEIGRATVAPNWPEEARNSFIGSLYSLRPAATGFSDTGVRYRTALYTLMATVGLVLLIACANIANLLLARAAARQREISVRMAIGASRRRVIRQLMTESLLLSALGAGAGFLFALWGSRSLVRLISGAGRPLEIDVTPDIRVFGFTLAVAILTAILFGLAPALHATGRGLNHALKEKSRDGLRAGSRLNLGKVLVSGQLALSLVLVIAAGLFLGTLRNLLTIDTGFNRQNVLLVDAGIRYAEIPPPQRGRTYLEILDRLRTVPGVVSAASSMITPISGKGWNAGLRAEGFTPQSRQDSMVMLNRVSPGYFQTLKIPIMIGRDFSEQDSLTSPMVMIIDQSTARHFLGTDNPVGKTVQTVGPSGRAVVYEVIGVVKNAKYARVNESLRRTAYLPASQEPEPGNALSYELRYAGSLESVTAGIRGVVADLNRSIALEFRDLETQVNDSILQQRVVALLSAVFGSLALLLAMVGLYGITSYAVARRKAEIGIRMALGAQRQSVVWLMMRDVLVLLAIGVSAGMAASLAAGQLVTTMLFGVRPNEPTHLAVSAVTLSLAAAIAAWLPAKRAARLDPMAALREE